MKILSNRKWNLIQSRLDYLEDYLKRTAPRIEKYEIEERKRDAQAQRKLDTMRQEFDSFVMKDKENREK